MCDWLRMFCVAGMIEKSAVNGLTDYFRNLCEYFTQRLSFFPAFRWHFSCISSAGCFPINEMMFFLFFFHVPMSDIFPLT